MFGRSKFLDLVGAVLALSILTIALAMVGMYVVLSLLFPEPFINQNLLTPAQHIPGVEGPAIDAVRQALAAGLLDASYSALACGIVWLCIASLWTPDRPSAAGVRGYLWTLLWAATAVGAWFLCVWPFATFLRFATNPEAFLPFRVAATCWAFGVFGAVTWVTTPSIAVPALGALGRLRYAVVRWFKPMFTRGVE